MKLKRIVKTAHRLSRPYRIDDGKHFRLKDVDPDDTGGLTSEDKPRAKEALQTGVEALAALQDMLYAQDRWALLLIFQAMDAAGKDGAIKHVMSGINPQGCQVYSFKAPSAVELDHDYLWRTHVCVPERGRIGIFNRSYYEEVLVVRVHPEILAAQRLPKELDGKRLFEHRYEDISAFERYLGRNGVVVRKFFLHVSRGEQKRRFLERLERPEKNWKFSSADLAERAHWGRYMRAYSDCLSATSTKWAPWYVIPADHKWFARLLVAEVINTTLDRMALKAPVLSPLQKRHLANVKRQLDPGQIRPRQRGVTPRH